MNAKLDRLRRLKDPSYAATAELGDVMSKIPMIKGDPGYTPIRGVDYFTEEDVRLIIDEVRALVKDGYTPVKGVDYSDGITPVKGVDYVDGIDGEDGKAGRTPVKGVDYWTSTERDAILAEVLQKVPTPKDGTTPKIEDIVAATIPVLRNKFSYTELKDAPALKDVEDLIAFLKRGGFRGGGSSGGAGTSPVTTKGDLYGFSTVADRIPVGANGTVLIADSTQALGVRWGAASGTGTVTSVASADGSITITNPTTAADLSVVKAPQLSTARNIDGQAFDGTANVTVIAPGTHAAASKTTPVDADEIPLADSAAAFVLKKLTWANLKATIKALTDTLYPSGSGTSSGTNTGDQTIQLTGDVTGTGTGTFAASVKNALKDFSHGFTTSGTVATGKVKGFYTAPQAATIVGWNLTVDAGTMTVRVWKIATGTAKPTVANNINTSGVAISSGTAIQSTTLTDFTTTAVAAGDIIAFEITAVSGVAEATFELIMRNT